MQRQRNALSLLHEVHVQQRVLLHYASRPRAAPTALVRVAVAIAALQVELVVDALVVEQVLHHLRLTPAAGAHHVVCGALLPAGLRHGGLVDAQHLAQQRGQSVNRHFAMYLRVSAARHVHLKYVCALLANISNSRCEITFTRYFPSPVTKNSAPASHSPHPHAPLLPPCMSCAEDTLNDSTNA